MRPIPPVALAGLDPFARFAELLNGRILPAPRILRRGFQKEGKIDEIDRRSALTFGFLTAVAAPLLAFSTPAAADVPNYSPTDGDDIGHGRRVIALGKRESQISAYKEIQVIDIAYQPGAMDPPDDPPMDTDMICFIIKGKFTIKKAGLDPYTVNEGEFYSCGKGKTDLATNIGDGVGIHRIALLVPA